MRKYCLPIIFAVVILSGVAACGQAVAQPTATPMPTSLPLPTATLAPTLSPVDSQRALTVNGVQRTYLIHIPAGLAIGQPAPLVFAFHGFSGDAESFQQATGFNDIADKAGFIVVYPNGSGPANALSWNAAGCCGDAMTNKVDESAFINQIIADLNTLAKIDPKLTYATGFSNGGFLSYRLACEMADTFAAVAPVAGALITAPCRPAQPVSIIQFHGVNDNVVPFAGGGTVYGTGLPFLSTEQAIAAWVQFDGCTASPQTDQAAVFTHTAYSFCKRGSAVELYAVTGIGHNWPSQYIVPASQLIWDFFAAHPKQ